MRELPITPPSAALIGGEWVDTAETLAVEAPASATPLAEIARCGGVEVDAAVAAARRAFEGGLGDWPAWSARRAASRPRRRPVPAASQEVKPPQITPTIRVATIIAAKGTWNFSGRGQKLKATACRFWTKNVTSSRPSGSSTTRDRALENFDFFNAVGSPNPGLRGVSFPCSTSRATACLS